MDVDLQVAAAKAPILGQEFLTWLWFRSERGDVFRGPGGNEFALFYEQRVSVLAGSGETRDTTVCSGPMSGLDEARAGLGKGKKVNQARIRIEQDANTWQFQVEASDFGVSGLKTPKVETRLEEGDDPDAPFLERIYLVEKSLEYLDAVFALFLEVRFGESWPAEAQSMRTWIREG
ncbi:MAG: hypothetical protein EOM25_08460 [Deltaproteobacteria bacterium]|nr:hypothetical protein [Deltaproteobacteria bacterium]